MAEWPHEKDLQGHDGPVMCCAFEPHGQFLATGSRDGTCRLWDLESGTCLRVLASVPVPSGESTVVGGQLNARPVPADASALSGTKVYACSFSPDGRLLAAAYSKHGCVVWEIATGQRRYVLGGHGPAVPSCAFSPCGTKLATGLSNGTCNLWSVETGTSELLLQGHTGPIMCCAYSPTGELLATASMDKTCRVWEATSPAGVSRHILRGHGDCIMACAFSPDGNLVATSSWDAKVGLWATSSGERLFTLSGHMHWVSSCSFSPDGRFLATASRDNTCRVWDVGSKQCLQTLCGRSGIIWSCHFSPDSQRLATAGEGGVCHLWRVLANQPPEPSDTRSAAEEKLYFAADDLVAAHRTSFLCPITLSIMRDPVTTCDGHTFERQAIEQWLTTHQTSPLTGAVLFDRTLTPNYALRRSIEEYCHQAVLSLEQPVPRSEILIVEEPVDEANAIQTCKGKWRGHDVVVWKVPMGPAMADVTLFAKLETQPHVVRFLCHAVESHHVYLCMEWAPLGSLEALLREPSMAESLFSPPLLLEIALQVCTGMASLAAQSCLHRYMGTRNVMVFRLNTEDPLSTLVKICPFGQADRRDVHHNETKTADFFPRCMSPEALGRGVLSKKSDVWAFGVLLWELYSGGRVPYQEIEDQVVGLHMKAGHLLPRLPEISEPVYELMQLCWRPKAGDRPTFDELRVLIRKLQVVSSLDLDASGLALASEGGTTTLAGLLATEEEGKLIICCLSGTVQKTQNTVTTSRRTWDGDLGKVFGKKKTVTMTTVVHGEKGKVDEAELKLDAAILHSSDNDILGILSVLANDVARAMLGDGAIVPHRVVAQWLHQLMRDKKSAIGFSGKGGIKLLANPDDYVAARERAAKYLSHCTLTADHSVADHALVGGAVSAHTQSSNINSRATEVEAVHTNAPRLPATGWRKPVIACEGSRPLLPELSATPDELLAGGIQQPTVEKILPHNSINRQSNLLTGARQIQQATIANIEANGQALASEGRTTTLAGLLATIEGAELIICGINGTIQMMSRTVTTNQTVWDGNVGKVFGKKKVTTKTKIVPSEEGKVNEVRLTLDAAIFLSGGDDLVQKISILAHDVVAALFGKDIALPDRMVAQWLHQLMRDKKSAIGFAGKGGIKLLANPDDYVAARERGAKYLSQCFLTAGGETSGNVLKNGAALTDAPPLSVSWRATMAVDGGLPLGGFSKSADEKTLQHGMVKTKVDAVTVAANAVSCGNSWLPLQISALQRELQSVQLKLMGQPEVYLVHLTSHAPGHEPVHVYGRSIEYVNADQDGHAPILMFNHPTSKSSATQFVGDESVLDHRRVEQKQPQGLLANGEDMAVVRLSATKCIFCGAISDQPGDAQPIDLVLKQPSRSA